MTRFLFYFVLLPALLPVILIVGYVYKQDKVEREPALMVLKALFYGALFSLADIPVERLLQQIIAAYYPAMDINYQLAENFLGVAAVEELTKWLVLYLFIWKSHDFDYKFDGIVYGVSASLGFAGLENIIYVIHYGTGVAVSRALFAIPGHAAFGIIMGFFLARAKHFRLRGHSFISFLCMVLCIAIPVCIHGTYDFLLSPAANSSNFSPYFFILVIVIDVISYRIIRHESRTGRPL
ncbi:MAG: PrsW family glutamic-type intramembrane protease [Treponema sp.]|nr:PrsW family glutamic-type intramembrane protease [Treponema sp.]